MIKSIVGGKHDDWSNAHGQREETLDDRFLPHGGIKQLTPLGLQKEYDAIDSTLQSDGPTQQCEENRVGKQSQKIGRLSGTFDASHYYQEYDNPGDK